MKHPLCVLVSALLAASACSKVSKRDAGRSVAADGGGGDAAPPAAPSLSDAELLRVFRKAADCRPSCAERDTMRAQLRSHPDQVALVAIEVMADPTSKTDQGVGLEAIAIVNDWLVSRPSAPALQKASVAMERVIAIGQTYMRLTAYNLLGNFKMPEAERILSAEARNLARDIHDRGTAAGALGRVLKSFEPIEQWLLSDDVTNWRIGLAAMRNYDITGYQERWRRERELTIAVGKRPDLPGDVVNDLAFFYAIYLEEDPKDPEVRPIAERLASHPDDDAAYQMRMILRNYTDWKSK